MKWFSYCIVLFAYAIFQSSEDCTAWLKYLSWWGSINTLAAGNAQQPAQKGSICHAGCDNLLRHTGMKMSSKTWGTSYGTIELCLSPSRSSLQQACHLEINCYAAVLIDFILFFNQLMYHLSWLFTGHYYVYWSFLSFYYFVVIYCVPIWKPGDYFKF